MKETRKDLQDKIDSRDKKINQHILDLAVLKTSAGDSVKEIEELKHTIRVSGQDLEMAKSDRADAEGEGMRILRELKDLFVEVNALRDVLRVKRKEWEEVHYEPNRMAFGG